MLLLHGGHPFIRNWLWFLHIAMFSAEHNSDCGVLVSGIWSRILLAMIFVGVASAAKRTLVALYLSRRMLQYYRQHLRDLLANMKLIMEVAELAAETETENFSKLVQEETVSQKTTMTGDKSRGGAIAR